MKRKQSKISLLALLIFLFATLCYGSEERKEKMNEIFKGWSSALYANNLTSLENFAKTADDFPEEKEYFQDFLLTKGGQIWLRSAIKNENVKLVKLLLQFFSKTDEEKVLQFLTFTDTMGRTPLTYLFLKDAEYDIYRVNELFNKEKNEIFKTLLDSFPNQPEEVMKLLLKKADMGYTCLHLAHNKKEEFRMLLEKIPKSKTEELMEFYLNDPQNSFLTIVKSGTKENLLFLLELLAKAEDEDLANLLLRYDQNGENALHAIGERLYLYGTGVVGAYDIPMMLYDAFPKSFDNGKKLDKFLNKKNLDNVKAFEFAFSMCLIETMKTNDTKNVERLLNVFQFENAEETRRFFFLENNSHEAVLNIAASAKDLNILQLLLWKIPLKGKEAIQFLMQEDGRPYMSLNSIFKRALYSLHLKYFYQYKQRGKSYKTFREENKKDVLGILMHFIWANIYEGIPDSPILDTKVTDTLIEVDARFLEYKEQLAKNALEMFKTVLEKEKRKYVRVLLHINQNHEFYQNKPSIMTKIKDYGAGPINENNL